MEKRQLIISEMLGHDTMNGVARYVEMLCIGLPSDLYEIIVLKFVHYNQIILPKRIVLDNYVEIIIPLPFNSKDIINNDYWRTEYNKVSAHIIEPYIKRNGIIHIQTINLIDFAVYLRKMYNFKIVSHIHCIPWKYKYSLDRWQFNNIYKKLVIEELKDNEYNKKFIMKDEYTISKESDAIINVTKNAVKYYKNYLDTPAKKLYCIYNGICDEINKQGKFCSSCKEPNGVARLLFVGSVTEEKGFPFILEALQIVKDKGYDFELRVAGKIDEKMRALVEKRYKNLNVKILGLVNYVELCSLYQSSHIGLISSLFEQCSYVALEMAMFGMPVVYSDIDELNEIFDKETGMSVPVDFSLYSGLRVDVCVFADKITRLIESPSLRNQIGQNVRKRFEEEFELEKMINKTTEVYNSLFKS